MAFPLSGIPDVRLVLSDNLVVCAFRHWCKMHVSEKKSKTLFMLKDLM